MKNIAFSLVVAAGSAVLPAHASEQYVPLGNLECVAAPGTGANAMACEFRSFTDGSAEVYLALAEQPGATKPAVSNWNVVSSGKTEYRKGGLAGDFVAREGQDILIGKENTGLILQPVQSTGAPGPAVIRLQAAK